MVLAAQLAASHGFWRALDLHVADECGVLRAGRQLLSGEANVRELFVWRGPYAVAYGLLDLVVPPLLVQDVMLAVVATASSLALLWALASRLSAAGATAGAVLWAVGSVYAGSHNGSYAFAAALAFLGAGALLRGREAAGVLFFALGSLSRPEVLLWAAPAGAFVLLRRPARRAAWALLATSALVWGGQAALDSEGRLFLAFSQHYARAAAERRIESGAPITSPDHVPFRASVEPGGWVRESFGNASSLSETLAANPAELARHALRNLRELPLEVGRLTGRLEAAPELAAVLAAVLLLLAVLGTRDHVGAMRRDRSDRRPGAEWESALVAGSPAILATSVVIGARADYLLPLLLPVLLLAARGSRRVTSSRAIARTPMRAVPPHVRAAYGLAVLTAILTLAPQPADQAVPNALPWRFLLAEASEEEGVVGVARPAFAAEVLLPGGVELVEPGADTAEARVVLLHAEDLLSYRAGTSAESRPSSSSTS